MRRKQRFSLADAIPILEKVHRDSGLLMNDSLADLRSMEKAGIHRVGVPYSLPPRLVAKFRRLIGRDLVDGVETRDLQEIHFYTGALIQLLRTVSR